MASQNRPTLVAARRAPALVLAAALLFTGPAAFARHPRRATVVWSSVVVHVAPPADAKADEKRLRALLRRESRRADWGAAGDAPVDATVEVKSLASSVSGGVAHASCTVVGRLKGGRAAKSSFSFGGRPDELAKLERKVLELAARGIVTRLAEMTRETPTRVVVRDEVGAF